MKTPYILGSEHCSTACDGMACRWRWPPVRAHVFASKILEHFELDGYFQAVFGAELSGERSDKTELLNHLSVELALSNEHTTMVGDREHDMIAARNTGMVGVGVLYGYGSVEELRAAGAAHIVSQVEELEALLGASGEDTTGDTHQHGE